MRLQEGCVSASSLEGWERRMKYRTAGGRKVD